ncbi:MAG TPA: FUSC family protein [Acetobacteraceae bacterium]|nr:FUSC family protein [Acetobacteraceae bacterium]
MRARAAPEAAGLPRGLLPLVTIDLRRTSIAEGVRAALSTAVIVALNEWLLWPPMMQAALAALLTCLCDPGGPIRKRLPAILCFGVLGALLTVGEGALRNAPLAVVVPVACAGIFSTLFVRVFGQAAQQVGNLLTVVQVLALTRTIHDTGTALALGGAFWGGSLWAALLTLVIWRVHPFLPARRAVAQVYRQLAALAGDLQEMIARGGCEESDWDAHARAQRRPVREAIEQARDAVLATVRARGPVSHRAAQTAIRLEAVEQMFGALIGLSEVLAAQRDPATDEAALRLLRRLRPVLVLLAHGIETDRIERLSRLERAATSIAAEGEAAPALRGAAEAIAERLRAVVTLAAPEGWTLGGPAEEPLRLALRRTVARIRANLDWQSEMLRHALRAAVAAAPALAVTLHWPTSYGHWLTIMLVMTLQPQVALTYARALERIAGTLAGGIVAAVLATVCTTPLAIAVAIFPLAVLTFALRPASFALFMASLTPLVVLLSELGRPGESQLVIAGMRALYVVIGSGLAVLAVLLLWPSWEPGRLGRELRTALLAHAGYARAEIGALLGEMPAAEVERARRAAGIASNNLEALLQRALLEPRGAADPKLAAALTVDAALRRMAGRVSVLQLETGTRRDPEAWRAWRDWIGVAAQHLAEARGTVPPRPTLPQDEPLAEALTRIARQMEIAAGALARLA